MNDVETRLGFLGQRARLIRDIFGKHGVEYMFIGKGAAAAQGFNAMTKDLDVYPSKSEENRRRLAEALKELGLPLEAFSPELSSFIQNTLAVPISATSIAAQRNMRSMLNPSMLPVRSLRLKPPPAHHIMLAEFVVVRPHN